jgi:hypothetical protein
MKTSESAFKSYLNEDSNELFKKSWFINAHNGLQFIIWERKVWVTQKKTFVKSSCEFVSTMNNWKIEFKSHPNEVFIDASKMH